MDVMVLTVDQRASRSGPDRVPDLLADLAEVPALSAFERTAGDEVQGLLTEPASVPLAVETLLRQDAWYVGIGVGTIDGPPPTSARAGRGQAYLHAREAVTSAKASPWHVRVLGEHPATRQLESALWLWAALLGRRTRKGWEVADLVDDGQSYERVARQLGVSPSAVSQRALAAGVVEGRRARELVAHLASELLSREPGS